MSAKFDIDRVTHTAAVTYTCVWYCENTQNGWRAYYTRYVQSRDLPEILVSLSERVSAFEFFDRTSVWNDSELLHEKPKNHSGIYYPDGIIYTKQELIGKNTSERKYKYTGIIRMMDELDVRAVRCRTGELVLFMDCDHII